MLDLFSGKAKMLLLRHLVLAVPLSSNQADVFGRMFHLVGNENTCVFHQGTCPVSGASTVKSCGQNIRNSLKLFRASNLARVLPRPGATVCTFCTFRRL